MFVLRSGDGSVVDSRLLRGHVEVVDFEAKVLLTGIQPRRTVWYLAHRDEITVRRGLELLSADIGHKRAVVKVKDLVNGWDGVCLVYAPLSRPRQQLWRSCTDRPLSFSPDGTRMVTTFIGSDGPGTGKLQVRVAETNKVLATLRTGGFFVAALLGRQPFVPRPHLEQGRGGHPPGQQGRHRRAGIAGRVRRRRRGQPAVELPALLSLRQPGCATSARLTP